MDLTFNMLFKFLYKDNLGFDTYPEQESVFLSLVKGVWIDTQDHLQSCIQYELVFS